MQTGAGATERDERRRRGVEEGEEEGQEQGGVEGEDEAERDGI